MTTPASGEGQEKSDGAVPERTAAAEPPAQDTGSSRTIHPVTLAGKYHHRSIEDTLNLYFLIGRAIGNMDRVLETLRREEPDLAKGIGDDAPSTELGPYNAQLKPLAQPFLQMFVCRLVDGFATYLSEVVREVLHAKPELLRSGEQVRVDYVLQFTSVEELRRDLIDRKVADLGYRGFVELERWFVDRLGVSVAADEEQRRDLVELIETRNVFVHNRGVVGAKYCRNVPGTTFEIGDQRLVDQEYIVHAVTILLGAGHSLDEVLGAKYGLGENSITPSA